MIKYGLDHYAELQFISFEGTLEQRDHQWIDIFLQPKLSESTPVPDDIIAFSILVICTHDGTVVQMIPQDEDCDCEYGFTADEKAQITAFVNSVEIQAAIQKLHSP
ncbi:hypothetical protein [Paenibacillus sp. HB172176]|uniref:hypothetical protein n=1 Tax=Paenibacillus sp. HB172176 TaxID=2493690 RepID=UPI001438B504|nr:hypothetical protein [Paenibacillus sp. HB172176]